VICLVLLIICGYHLEDEETKTVLRIRREPGSLPRHGRVQRFQGNSSCGIDISSDGRYVAVTDQKKGGQLRVFANGNRRDNALNQTTPLEWPK